MNLFVTVGSTRFDCLIESISNNNAFIKSLIKYKFDSITIQHGSGNAPTIPINGDINIKCLDYCDNINELLEKADLIITHAGAGTLLECLRMKNKRIIAITNDTLMHGHQQELAFKLYEQGYISYSTCCSQWTEYIKSYSNCCNLLDNVNSFIPKEYPEKRTDLFYDYLNNLVGFDMNI